MEAPAARRLLRAANAETAELAGTKTLKILVMVNTKTKFPRGILDQAISLRAHDGERERAPDPGLKLQASSGKQQAASFKRQAFEPTSSFKRQATSIPTRVTSVKLQA